MKKKLAISIILLFIIACASCSYSNYKSQAENNVNSTVKDKVQKNSTKKIAGYRIGDNSYDITAMLLNKNSNVRYIHSLDKDRIYLVTEDPLFKTNGLRKKITIKLYDIIKNKVEKQVCFEKKSRQYNFLPLINGFYVIEVTDMTKSGKVFYHIYDSSLNLKKTLDLTNLSRITLSLPVLSNKCDKIAYIDKKSLCIYTCDLAINNKQKIAGIEPCKVNKLFTYHDISFMDGDKQLAFIGSIYKNSEVQPKVFGTININSGKIMKMINDGVSNDIQICKGKTFFTDAFTEFGKDSSGKVFLIENATNKVNEYTLKDKNESQKAYISDKGTYIVTHLDGKLENGQPIYRFRIYDARKKVILQEFDTVFKGKDYLKCGIQRLCICEANNSFFVVYRIGEEKRLYMYNFN